MIESNNRKAYRIHRQVDSNLRVNGLEVDQTAELKSGDWLQVGDFHCHFDSMGLEPFDPCNILVHNLSYATPSGRRLLRNVNLDIRPGTLTAILGPSGCGKSTLLDCMLGSRQPDEGSVHFFATNGNQQKSLPADGRTIGFVPQQDVLFHNLTVEENLRLASRYRLPGMEDKARSERIETVLSLMGLRKQRSQLVSELSGGERKRVNVGTELLAAPSVMILDEPTSGLDPGMQGEIMGCLGELRKRGVTVLYVTHEISTLIYVDHVVLLRGDGELGKPSVAYQGSPDPLRQLSEQRRVEVFRSGEVPGGFVENAEQDWETPNAKPDVPLWVTYCCKTLAVTLQRAVLNLWRDPLHLVMALLVPLLLGVLIFLAQGSATDECESYFSATKLILAIAALWQGMILCVREIVAEREIVKRELWAGLDKTGYVLGKIGYALGMGLIQAGLMTLAFAALARINPSGIAPEKFAEFFSRTEPWFRGMLISLWACGFCGGLVGLLVSAFARSQALALTLLPLFLIPHLLFNRPGIRETVDPGSSDIYRPIYYRSWKAPNGETQWRRPVHNGGSLLLITRPALNIMLAANPYKKDDEITKDNRRAYRKWVYWEGLYMGLLLGGHVVVFAVLFGAYGPGGSYKRPRPRRKE